MLRPLLALAALASLACSSEAPEAPDDAPSRVARAAGGSDVEPRLGLRSVPATADPAKGGGRRALPPRVAPDGHVTVTVVDHAGRPVPDIEVIGFDLDDEGERPHRIRFTFAEATGADGRAFLPPERQGMRYAASLFDGRPAVSTAEDPTRIALPPCGSLRVDQSRHADATRLRVQSVRDGRPLTFRAGSLPSGRIDLIPVGVRLELGSIGPLEAVTATIPGPAEPGEVVEWRPRPSARLRVRARLGGADGAPLAGMSATLWRDRGSLLLRSVDRTSGAVAGELLREHWGLEPGETAIVREFDGDRLDAGLLEGAVRAPVVGDDRAVDLGDVELLPHPLVTAGRVVDARGEPVSGVDVRLQWRPEHRRTPSALGAAYGTAGDLERMDRGGAPFASLDVTDVDGRFALRSRAPLTAEEAAQVYIEAREPGRHGAVESLAVELGRTDLRIVLQEFGRVRVDLSAAPASTRPYFGARLLPADSLGSVAVVEPTRAPRTRPASIEARVPPGRYDVEVTFGTGPRSEDFVPPPQWEDHTVVAVLEDVDVPSGADSTDTRLDPLVLPLKTATLRCAGGEPLSAHTAQVTTVPPSTAAGDPVHVDRTAGSVTWLDLEAFEHVFVRIGPHAPVDLVDLPDGALVDLVALQPFELRFDGAPAPEPRIEVEVLPSKYGWPQTRRGAGRILRSEGGTHRISLARGESYRLSIPPWIVVQGDGDPKVVGSPESVRRDWHGLEFTAPSSGDVIVLRPN